MLIQVGSNLGQVYHAWQNESKWECSCEWLIWLISKGIMNDLTLVFYIKWDLKFGGQLGNLIEELVKVD